MPSLTIGEHLVKRLSEVGVDTVFGVPGDYNMVSAEEGKCPSPPVVGYVLTYVQNIASLGYH